MAIDWLSPSDEILEARRIGYQERQSEVDELQAEVERLRPKANAWDQTIAMMHDVLGATLAEPESNTTNAFINVWQKQQAEIERLEARLDELREYIDDCRQLDAAEAACPECRAAISCLRHTREVMRLGQKAMALVPEAAEAANGG